MTDLQAWIATLDDDQRQDPGGVKKVPPWVQVRYHEPVHRAAAPARDGRSLSGRAARRGECRRESLTREHADGCMGGARDSAEKWTVLR